MWFTATEGDDTVTYQDGFSVYILNGGNDLADMSAATTGTWLLAGAGNDTLLGSAFDDYVQTDLDKTRISIPPSFGPFDDHVETGDGNDQVYDYRGDDF